MCVALYMPPSCNTTELHDPPPFARPQLCAHVDVPPIRRHQTVEMINNLATS